MRPWVLFCILTLLLFGGWTVTPKAGPIADLTGYQQQALSSVGLLPVLAALALSRRIRGGAAPVRGSAWAFLAGLLTASGNIAYYEALKGDNPATSVVPLTALYPLVTVVLATVFLREKPNAIQAAGIALALAALYVLNPLGKDAALASVRVLVLLPIAFWGLAGILQKLATRCVSGEKATLWFLAAFFPVAAVILLRDGGLQRTLSGAGWALTGLLGLLFGLGNLTLLLAYGSGGKASVVAPISGLYSVVSIPLAMLCFKETIQREQALGIGLSLVAVVALSIEKASEAPRPAGAPALQSGR
jgi:transporter family protein